MLKPLIYAGLCIMTAKKILTHVILPAVCYCDHNYDIDGNIKLHDVLKTLLHASYKPPEETLCLLADISLESPKDSQYLVKYFSQ